MVSRYSLIFLLAIFFSGCSPATAPPAPSDQTPNATDPAPGTTQAPQARTTASADAARIRDAQYQLGTPDSLQVVQLVDGQFEQGTPGSADFISVHVTDFVAAGDLNANGVDEVAALISENYGGTGVFVFLAIYTNVDGALAFQTSSIVDDRPQLNALSIETNEIYLDATIHGFEEPMCCPTFRTTRHYRLAQGGQLEMTDFATFTPDGKPRTITIESPASGSEVFSSVQIKGSVAIAPFENNLTYSIQDVGGIELARGAIPVSATEPGAPGTFDTVISLGNILSGAVIKLEVQDISAADGSLFTMDSIELVVK